MPLAHRALPRTHPISSETNVTEFGSKPAGTAADTGDGVGAGVVDGDADGDGRRLGAALVTADGLGLGECCAGAEEHAASRMQADPAPASNGLGRNVRVIDARNASIGSPVTTAVLTLDLR